MAHTFTHQAKEIAAGNTIQAGVQANNEALAIGNALGGGFPQVGGGQVQFTVPSAGGGFQLGGFGGNNIYSAAINQAGQFNPTGAPGLPNFGFSGPNSGGFSGGGFSGGGGGGINFFGGGSIGQQIAGNDPRGFNSFLSQILGGGGQAFNPSAQGGSGGQGQFRDQGGQSGISGTGGQAAASPQQGQGGGQGQQAGPGFSGFGQQPVNFQPSPFTGTGIGNLLSTLQGRQPFGPSGGFSSTAAADAQQAANPGLFGNFNTSAGFTPQQFDPGPGGGNQIGFANRFAGGPGFKEQVNPRELGLFSTGDSGPTSSTSGGFIGGRQGVANPNQPFNTQDPNAGRSQASGFLRGPEDAQFLLDSGIIDQAMFDRILPIAQRNASVSGPGTTQVPQGSVLPGGFTNFADANAAQQGGFDRSNNPFFNQPPRPSTQDNPSPFQGGSQLASNDLGGGITLQGQAQHPQQGRFDPNRLQTEGGIQGSFAPGTLFPNQGQAQLAGNPQQSAPPLFGSQNPGGGTFDPNAPDIITNIQGQQGQFQAGDIGQNGSQGFLPGSAVQPGGRQPFGTFGPQQGGFQGGSQLAQNTGQPFQGGFIGRGRFDEAGNQSLNQLLNQLAPGFSQNIPGGIASDSDFFGQQAGIFSGDPAQLPGEAGPNLLGFAANLTLQRAIEQAGLNRAGNEIGIAATNRLAGGPAVTGTENLLRTLSANPFTTSSDALQGEIEGLISRRSAENQQATSAGLRDRLSASGLGGGESELLKAGSQFGSRARLADDLAEARINQALRRQSDITTGLGSFARGGDTLTSQIFNPSMQLAQFLRGGAANPLADEFVGQVRDLGGLAIEDELRENADSGALDTFLSILGGLGGFAGNLQGGR